MSQSIESFWAPTYYELYHLNQKRPAIQKAVVYIVNDQEERQHSLHRITRSAQWETKIYSSAEAFLDNFDPVGPSCLLLDINVPTMGGLALQAQLHTQRHSLPILFISARGTVLEAVQALRAGAVDFMIEPVRRRILLTRVRECIEKNQKDQDTQWQRKKIAARVAKLSPREREVMELAVRGKLNKLIASELNISTKTVERHRFQMMKKLHARNQAELIWLDIMRSGVKSAFS
jgi:two-component system, LuxR family, response regulator FixJ